MISEMITWVKNNWFKVILIVVSVFGGLFIWKVTRKCTSSKLYGWNMSDARYKTIVDNTTDLTNKFEYKDGNFSVKSKCGKIKANFKVIDNAQKACEDVINKKIEACLINTLSIEDIKSDIKVMPLVNHNLYLHITSENMNDKVGLLRQYEFMEAIIKKIAGFENLTFVYFDNETKLMEAMQKDEIYAIVDTIDSKLVNNNVPCTIVYAPAIIYTSDEFAAYLSITLDKYEEYAQRYEKECKACKSCECVCPVAKVEEVKKEEVKETKVFKTTSKNTTRRSSSSSRSKSADNSAKISELKERLKKIKAQKSK